MDALDDIGLVQLAKARDEAAIRALTRRYNRRLFRLARSILRNDAEAEDVVQETYVRAFTALDSFAARPRSRPGSPASRINEAFGRLRRQRPTVDWEHTASTRARPKSSNFPLPR